jgi:dihydroorotase
MRVNRKHRCHPKTKKDLHKLTPQYCHPYVKKRLHTIPASFSTIKLHNLVMLTKEASPHDSSIKSSINIPSLMFVQFLSYQKTCFILTTRVANALFCLFLVSRYSTQSSTRDECNSALSVALTYHGRSSSFPLNKYGVVSVLLCSSRTINYFCSL